MWAPPDPIAIHTEEPMLTRLAILAAIGVLAMCLSAVAAPLASVSEPGETVEAFGLKWSLLRHWESESGTTKWFLLGTRNGIEAYRYLLTEHSHGGGGLWVADLDGDGTRDLIHALSPQGSGGFAYGLTVWTAKDKSVSLAWTGAGQTTLADLDADGVAEIMTSTRAIPVHSGNTRRHPVRVLSWKDQKLKDVTQAFPETLSEDVKQAKADADTVWRPDLCSGPDDNLDLMNLHAATGVLAYAALVQGDLREAQRQWGLHNPCTAAHEAVLEIGAAMIREEQNLGKKDE